MHWPGTETAVSPMRADARNDRSRGVADEFSHAFFDTHHLAPIESETQNLTNQCYVACSRSRTIREARHVPHGGCHLVAFLAPITDAPCWHPIYVWLDEALSIC